MDRETPALLHPVRLAALQRVHLLDTPPEAAFDRLTRLAARTLHAPVALISLVDADRQFFKSAVGLPEPWASRRETPLSHSFCQYIVATRSPLIVEDTRIHPQLKDSAAIHDLHAIAFAGIPLIVDDQVIGALCVLDHLPRAWTDAEIEILSDLAAAVMTEIQLHTDLAERSRWDREREALLVREQAAQAEADRARQQLYDAFMQAPAIINVLRGPEHIFDFVNHRWLAVVGAHDVVGKPVREAQPDLAGQGVFELLDHVYTSGEPFVGNEVSVYTDRHGNGVLEEGFFNFIYQPIRDAEGRVQGILSHAVDVSDQVHARQAVERSREEARAIADQLRLITDALPAFISYIDTEQRYQFTNAAYEQWFGLTDEQLRGKTIAEVAGAEAYSNAQPSIQRALAGEQTSHENTTYSADGTPKHVYTQYIPDVDEHGEVRGFVVLGQDITERKQLEQRRNEFLSLASHELKTPVTSVKGLTELLLRSAHKREVSAKELRALDTINQQVDRMTRLVNDMLDVSRIEVGKFMVTIDAVDLCALLTDVVEQQQMVHPTHTLKLDAQPPCVVQGNADRLQQVMLNLLANAIQHSPAESTISVSMYHEQDRVVVAVQDQGCGILKDKQDHVFERFYQAQDTPARGLGLGLYLVKEIIEHHHGRVWLESDNGNGCTFFFSLPKRGV